MEIKIKNRLIELAEDGLLGEGALRGELQVVAQQADEDTAKTIHIIISEPNIDLRATILEFANDEDEASDEADSIEAMKADDKFESARAEGTFEGKTFEEPKKGIATKIKDKLKGKQG